MASVDPWRMANAIRFLSMDAIERVGEGHPGTPLGAADIADGALHAASQVQSRGPALVRPRPLRAVERARLDAALLAAPSDRLREDQRSTRSSGSGSSGSHCEGHPEFDPTRGIEITTGPLGQGIANAAGMAVAEAFLNQWLGPELVDHHTYALVGDGCLQEGVGQEVISLAGHLRPRQAHLPVGRQPHDRRRRDRHRAVATTCPPASALSNWHVQEVDGHDPEAVAAALPLAKADPAAVDDRLHHRHRPRPARGRGHARRP